MKSSKRLGALVCALALLLSVAAGAAETVSDGEYQESTHVVNPANLLGPEDPNAICEDADMPDPNNMARYSSTQLFNMKATSVSSLLTTRSAGKSFSLKDFSNISDDLKISGKLTHTNSNANYARVGACIYLPTTGEYEAIMATDYFALGSSDNHSWKVSGNVLNGMTCYGFIKNSYGSGSVSGTLYFYDVVN